MHFDFASLKHGTTNRETTIVVAGAHDDVVISAIKDATSYLPLKLVLIGDQPQIGLLLSKHQLTGEIIHETDPIKIGDLAVQCIKDKKANVIMKGLLDTKFVLKAVVNSAAGIKARKVLSHVALMDLPHTHQQYLFTDGAMNIAPNAEDKWEIVLNAVEVAHKLGVTIPKVGIVSAVEKVNPKIQSTVDAQTLITRAQTSNTKDFLIDGPFAIDNLLSMEAVKHKGINSPVAGNPDILLFPELVSGNVFYKTCVFAAGGIPAGVIVGATAPIILTSRADSTQSKMNSILLGVKLGHA